MSCEEGVRIVVNGGKLTFLRPDGRVLPNVPPAPALAHDPGAVLRAANPADGWTAVQLPESTRASTWIRH